MHIPFFRIFYSTTFTLLTLLLAGLMLITPGDQIYQAFRHRQIFHIFIIAGTHLLAFLAAVFIYAGRLFANRSALANIPRAWSPVEKGDVEWRVRRVVIENLKRSALIAYKAHPRDLQNDEPITLPVGNPNAPAAITTRPQESTRPIPVWGTISHPGWTSPSSPDLPNLHFSPIILELPHLIEAKAVSLAPPDPFAQPTTPIFTSPPPDPLAVSLLQRPAPMGLRDYISYLITLSMIRPPSLGASFLTLYEQARFSVRPLAEDEFRSLMSSFAEFLRGMTALEPTVAAALLSGEDGERTSDAGTSEAGSVRTDATVEYTPLRRDSHVADDDEEASSSAEAASSPSPPANRPVSPSSSSLRSVHNKGIHPKPCSTTSAFARSRTSSRRSGDSVIRLAEAHGPLDLPYTILPPSSLEPGT